MSVVHPDNPSPYSKPPYTQGFCDVCATRFLWQTALGLLRHAFCPDCGLKLRAGTLKGSSLLFSKRVLDSFPGQKVAQ